MTIGLSGCFVWRWFGLWWVLGFGLFVLLVGCLDCDGLTVGVLWGLLLLCWVWVLDWF